MSCVTNLIISTGSEEDGELVANCLLTQCGGDKCRDIGRDGPGQSLVDRGAA